MTVTKRNPIECTLGSWFTFFFSGNLVFSAIVGLEASRLLARPKRICKVPIPACRLCGKTIDVGSEYHNGGKNRAHHRCSLYGVEAFAKIGRAVKAGRKRVTI